MADWRYNVRGTPPVAPNTFDEHAIWLGPDEWLASGTATGRVVDVSDQRAAIEATREQVARGCTLDLDALKPGSCAQTLVAQIPTIILAHAAGLQLLVGSSYAEHLREWLTRP